MDQKHYTREINVQRICKKKSFITFKITFDKCLPVVENNEEQLKNLYALGVFFQYSFTYQDDLENKQRTLSSLTNVFRI